MQFACSHHLCVDCTVGACALLLARAFECHARNEHEFGVKGGRMDDKKKKTVRGKRQRVEASQSGRNEAVLYELFIMYSALDTDIGVATQNV